MKAMMTNKISPAIGANRQIAEKAEIEKAARDFESILIGQFFKLMHSTIGDSGVIERSFSRKIYEEMMQDEIAKEFSKSGGLSLNKVLVDRFVRIQESNSRGRGTGEDGPRMLSIGQNGSMPVADRMMRLKENRTESNRYLPTRRLDSGKGRTEKVRINDGSQDSGD
ncbi:MAG: rod-binding protein [Bacteroidales bacterium]|nr:rod-binding protein [Candidatus Latescibacterota bacterium]